MIAQSFIELLGGYQVCGVGFRVLFVLVGVKRVDVHALHGSWGFRLLILPGSVLLWPLLLSRWWTAGGKPPEEKNSHRLAAQKAKRV